MNQDDSLLSDIHAVVNTLPGSTLEDFLKTLPLPSTSHPRRGWHVFDCRTEDGRIEPLHPADHEHPLWKQIHLALDTAEPRVALALPDHIVLLTEPGPESPARTLVIPDHDIVRVLQSTEHGEQLTDSELRLLKQLVCGLGLSEAGKLDGVSHETKRTQYKSLSHKLAVRSQNELTNKVLTCLLLDLHTGTDNDTSQTDEYFIELAQDFIPSARCFLLRGASGMQHRFVDIGPVSGRPVAFIHPLILPDIRQDDVTLLHEQDLRLIIPLRNGAMSQTATHLSITGHLDHACEGIDLVRTHFAGEKLDLMLCISGCAYGIEYARRYPDRIRSFALVGAGIQPIAHTSIAGRLRAGLSALATANWRVYSAMVQFLCRHICKPDNLRRMVLRYYRPSAADSAVIKAEYAASHGGERGRKLFTASVESMTHDFYHQGQLRWETLPSRQFPMAFFHGDQDVIHRIDDVRAMAESLGGIPVYAIPGAGQLLYYGYFQSLLAACSAFFSNSPDLTEQKNLLPAAP